MSLENLCYYDKLNDDEANKLEKGPSIINESPYEKRSIECRINLKKRLFRVGTVENPNKIDPADLQIGSIRTRFKDKVDHSEAAES